MGKINVLPFAVANLIAAGEVVDRPASVIKELTENAIDAGATQITVEIQRGGVSLMRVTDNGCGMSPEDLPVAIRRHATSKIRRAEDLESIVTLGFRGEALAAIASVSDLRILSRQKGAENGAILEAKYGEIQSLCEQGCREGTTVLVENLFENVPARRKFLKKDVTEGMAVQANVEKIALSHPEIAFRLILEGNTKLETPGDGDLSHAIRSIFGRDITDKLLEINTESEGIGIRGYIGRTDNFRANRNYENFFINGRFVKSKTASASLEQAYTSYMPPEKFPFAVLFLSINPARVDVNVHPAKLEVKFSNEKAVFEGIYYGVRNTLESNVTRPNFELTVPKPNKNGFALPLSERTAPIENGRREGLSQRQYKTDFSAPSPSQTHMTASEFRDVYRAGRVPDTGYTTSKPTDFAQKKEENAPISHISPSPPVSVPSPSQPQKETESPPNHRESLPSNTEPLPNNTKPDSPPIPAEKKTEAEQPGDSSYRIIGEAFHAFVLVEKDDKLLIIDKHAAHERILFERLKASMLSLTPCSQMLLVPVEVPLTSGETEILQSYDKELSAIGFSLRYERNFVYADAIPEEINAEMVKEMLETIAFRLLNATGSVRLTRDIIFEKALYQASCKASVKGGRQYADGHIEWIVSELMKLPDITFCPHGRPVALELPHHTLDKQFDRTGF